MVLKGKSFNQSIMLLYKCFEFVVNEWWGSNGPRLGAFAQYGFNVVSMRFQFSMCCGCVLHMFSTCFQCVGWASKLNDTCFCQTEVVKKKHD